MGCTGTSSLARPVAALRRALGAAAAVAIVLAPVHPLERGSGGAGAGRPGGEVAVVVHGRLELLGSAGTTFAPGQGTVSDPRWSADGRWVAFMRPSPTAAQPGRLPQLWAVRADGTDLRRISPVGRQVTNWAWAPSGQDVLAYEVLVPPAAGQAASAYRCVLDMATPPVRRGGAFSVRRLETSAGAGGALAWSPDGTELALSYRPASAKSQRVVVTPWSAWSPRTVHAPSQAAGSCTQLQGWWPDGRGLLVWQDPYCSASIAADGLTLTSVSLGPGRAIALGTMLVHQQWVSWAPSGGQLAFVAGGDREVWVTGKHLELCRLPGGGCRSVPVAPGRMALAPAWEPDGRLVYDVAPAGAAQGAQKATGTAPGWAEAPFTEARALAWYGAMRLYETGPGGTGPSYVAAAGQGAHDPVATPGGLLFVRGTSLWYLRDGATKPVHLAAGLGDPSPYGSYYGYIDWSQDFAWQS